MSHTPDLIPTARTTEAADEEPRKRVAYLLGAGATHGSIRFKGSISSLIMPGLIEPLLDRMREKYIEKYTAYPNVGRLVNEVVDHSTDFEHLITFLEDTPSSVYRQFGEDLKGVFSTVLRTRLNDIRAELEPHHSELYAVLLDMHQLEHLSERAKGFLTLNYDLFLEHAIEARLGFSVDYGLDVDRPVAPETPSECIRVLKLHGSFGWRDVWPIAVASENDPGLWIPPGIRKAKSEYPFNLIWGAARELLDCDVLRIIGCNLGPNDWDLVSLLFTTMHSRESVGPYEIELIGRPSTALRMNKDFPYLRIRSLLEIPEVGPQLIAEVLGCEPTEFSNLNDEERSQALSNGDEKLRNPFEHWLRIRGELMLQNFPSLSTPHGIFEDFVVSVA